MLSWLELGLAPSELIGQAPDVRHGPQPPLGHVSPDSRLDEELSGYVVAIGASAGGLDALEHLFDELPEKSEAAFVVIQHLSPDHKSMMANLLARHTQMPVVIVQDEMTLELGKVYLIPPGKDMTVVGRRLRLSPKNPRALSLPIDLFFTSLARSFGNRSVGIVLSGTGSDGTRGAMAINDAGGLLMAQDPQSAKFDGMPRSVIATGLVDAVLPPKNLALRLMAHIRSAPPKHVEDHVLTPEDSVSGTSLTEIIHVLHRLGGINFHDYKPATVLRRIERRMQVRHVRDLDGYRQMLESDRGEVAALRREILIPVTNFFRDPDAFDYLASHAIRRIVEEQCDGQPVRVWVAGTSTGEEAYSIAILFCEAFERAKRWPPIKIFSTDVEQNYVDAASAGVFSDSIVAEVSPERLDRFFERKGNRYVVKSEVRKHVIFARHNLLEDPPFTRLDLITCRNALIYLEAPAQGKIIGHFQYALAPNGYVFLGLSETLGPLARNFTPVSSKYKIYRVLRQGCLPLETTSGPLVRTGSMRRKRVGEQQRAGWPADSGAIEAGQALLLHAYAPPSILISEQRELVHVFGEGQRFLKFQEGAASLDAARLLPTSLAPIAKVMMHKVLKETSPLCSEPVHHEAVDGAGEMLRLFVRLISERSLPAKYLLLSFEPAARPLGEEERGAVVDVAAENNERVESLERELAATRDSLQATIEELETSNEELQATNEELMASNEELQSTNEELQSVNEELYTVNSEYQEKIDILNRLNDDLDHMTRAACIPTLFVDHAMKLTRFTAEAMTLFRIRETDVGRSLDDFTSLLDYPLLTSDLRRTLTQGLMIEREVKSTAGRWYLARLVPYSEQPNGPNGAVITFIDVTSLKDFERLQQVLDSLPEHVLVLDTCGRVTMANRIWRDFLKDGLEQQLECGGIGLAYRDVLTKALGVSADWTALVWQGINQVISGDKESIEIEFPCLDDPCRSWYRMYAAPVRWESGGAVVSHANISVWVDSHERTS